MMRTMRSKLILGIAGIMLLTIVTIIFFVWDSTSKTLHRQQESEAHNLLAFTHLLVATEYQSILFHEQEMMRIRKDELRDILDTVFAMLETLHEKSRRGVISEAEAQRQALEYLKNIRYDSGIGYIFVNDTRKPIPRMIMHPEIPALDGEILDDPAFNCAYGTDLNLFSAFRNVCENDGEGYVDYMWPKPLPDGSIGEEQPKVSYVRMFGPWRWVVGTGLYTDDIQQSAKRRLDVVESELQEALSRLRISNSGYVFIFNGSKEFIVHPSLDTIDLGDHLNPDTGNLLIDDLIEAAALKLEKLDYHWIRPGYDNERLVYPKITYITYYKPLDWYLCASYYIDDVQRTAVRLRNTIIIISSAFLLLAFGMAFIFANYLVKPLKHLANDASRISKEGVKGQSVIETGPSETVELGRVLNKMLASLRASEMSLLESREDLRITLNSIGDAVIATDDTGRITRMNPEAEKITGWRFEFAQGRKIDEVLHLLDRNTRERIASPVDTAIEKREAVSLTTPVLLVARDGQEFVISDSAAPIVDPDDRLIGSVIVFRDITSEIEAERQLRQRQKMDSIGQLAGGIAHDFNNMLAGILGFAELLGMKAEDDPQTKKLVEGISKSAVTASELVGKLLSFARENPLIHKEFDFHECLDDALVLLQRSVDRSIELVIDKRAQDSFIRGDSAQLENIVLNLGINARDAMPNGGVLTFETDNVFLDAAFCDSSNFDIESGEYLMVKCTDSGVGIPSKIIENIFEPYFTTKEVGKGSGLGLAAVFGTIQAHHGAIFVYSEVGKGTSFHVYLPIVKAEDDTPREKKRNLLLRGEGHVLVIDDEKLVRNMAKGVLGALGYTVYLASDGIEGLRLYEDLGHVIDVVILDMIMPNMSGEVCFHELRRLNPDIKIIISSGFAKNNAIDRLLQAGAAGYIKKPYTMRGISSLLYDVLELDKTND